MRPGDVLDSAQMSSPPVDILSIARRESVRVLGVTEARWDGALERNRNQATVYVNLDNEKTRQRFTVAHELAHHFLHGSRSRVFRCRFADPKFDVHEIEANRFAVDLLVPSHWLRAYLRYENISQLAERFQVSDKVIEYRLDEFGYARR